jgi:hypothetical protein
MKKIKLPKAKSLPKTTHSKSGDVVRSTPKTTHARAISVPKHTYPGRNLGKYLHKSKLPTGAKIGADVVKMKKPRKSKKGY